MLCGDQAEGRYLADSLTREENGTVMKYFGNGLSEMHKELSRIIRNEREFDRARQLFLDIHAKLNLSEVSGTEENEVDLLFRDLDRGEYAIMPTSKDETIAWVLWHIARIEDLTMNLLVARQKQVLDERWSARLKITVKDTGNAMSDEEIMKLSKEVQIDELMRYRNEVAGRTREIVKNLRPQDLRRKMEQADLGRILDEGGLTTDENSVWLLDFWGKKDVAGLLLMPPTRHVMLHLNSCCKWKARIRTGSKCYMRSV